MTYTHSSNERNGDYQVKIPFWYFKKNCDNIKSMAIDFQYHLLEQNCIRNACKQADRLNVLQVQLHKIIHCSDFRIIRMIIFFFSLLKQVIIT